VPAAKKQLQVSLPVFHPALLRLTIELLDEKVSKIGPSSVR
jgi:hypothetical protein